MEHLQGELKANKRMKPAKISPKRRTDKPDPTKAVELKLKEAERRSSENVITATMSSTY